MLSAQRASFCVVGPLSVSAIGSNLLQRLPEEARPPIARLSVSAIGSNLLQPSHQTTHRCVTPTFSIRNRIELAATAEIPQKKRSFAPLYLFLCLD
jgi:hypothetical protein